MAKVKTIEIVDIENVRNEKLRYQNNSLAYWLGLLACLISVFAGIVGLNTMKPGAITIVKILLNVVILLIGFACAENIKHYSAKSSYVYFGFGMACFLRIFWFPLQMIKWWRKYQNSGDQTVLSKHFSKLVYGDKSAISNIDSVRGYFPQSGYFRGILMIILLVVSGLLFAFSGYIGLIKTNKLKRYLKSIDVKM